MFSITGGEIPVENVTASKQSASAELTTAQAEFNRVSELIKDKLITQGEFQAAKLRFESARIAVAKPLRRKSWPMKRKTR